MKKQFLIEVDIPKGCTIKHIKWRIKCLTVQGSVEVKFLPLPKPVNYFEEKRKREQGKY